MKPIFNYSSNNIKQSWINYNDLLAMLLQHTLLYLLQLLLVAFYELLNFNASVSNVAATYIIAKQQNIIKTKLFVAIIFVAFYELCNQFLFKCNAVLAMLLQHTMLKSNKIS